MCSGSALGIVTCRGQHQPGQLDGNRQRKVDPFGVAVLVIRVVAFSEFRQPGRPVGRLRHGDQRRDPPRDGDRVAAKGVLSDPGFEEGNPRAPPRVAFFGLPSVELGERVVHGARAAVEVLVPGFLGDLRQNLVDQFVGVGAALAAGDHLEGDLDGAFQLGNRLIEVGLPAHEDR